MAAAAVYSSTARALTALQQGRSLSCVRIVCTLSNNSSSNNNPKDTSSRFLRSYGTLLSTTGAKATVNPVTAAHSLRGATSNTGLQSWRRVAWARTFASSAVEEREEERTVIELPLAQLGEGIAECELLELKVTEGQEVRSTLARN